MSRNLPYKRFERVASQIFEVISEAFYTELGGASLMDVHITQVRVTPDLRTARVYFHIMNNSEERLKEVTKAMELLKGRMRKLIGSELNLKYTPEIKIFYDEGVDASERVDQLLRGNI
ncbi:MAG: 30S ribosome-binding factor RbfA [Pseudomonadota bacterium]